MSSSLHLAHRWWAALDQADGQRVWQSRHSYLPRDLVESMANAGVPVVSDGRWSCVSIGPTGFTCRSQSSNSWTGCPRGRAGERHGGPADRAAVAELGSTQRHRAPHARRRPATPQPTTP
jgi:hypothetical protein